MEKGLTPLIAALLLIAATVTIATVLTFWASSYLKSTFQKTSSVTGLMGADFVIYSCNYQATTPTSGRINFILHNTKGIDINGLSVSVSYSDGTTKTFSSEIQPDNSLPGEGKYWYKSFSIDNINPSFTKVTVKSTLLPIVREALCQ